MRLLRPLAVTVAAALLQALLGTGCVYRMDIQQGNLLDAEQIDQVEVGMTRSQVRFLLGTPMVIDSSTRPLGLSTPAARPQAQDRKAHPGRLVRGDKVARRGLIAVPRAPPRPVDFPVLPCRSAGAAPRGSSCNGCSTGPGRCPRG
jgi:outer membrane protein assembly factor BamE